ALDGVLPDLDQALGSLYPVARNLPGGLSALRRLSGSADPALQALRRPVHKLVPLATALVPLSGELRGSLHNLGPQLPDFTHVIGTLAKCTTPLYAFFQW